MLSPNARAFSVDELLGKRERGIVDSKLSPDAASNDVTKSSKTEDTEELCPSLGDDNTCNHRNVIRILDKTNPPVTVELCQAELWDAFHSLGTEMIITKTGRRMFPALRVRISGLKKTSQYKIYMEFVSVDKNKYRYVYHSSKWMISGIGETMRADQKYLNPDCPMSGEYIATQVVSFGKIKLTNNENPTQGQISLMSMQRFQPRIIIEEIVTDNADAGNRMSASFPQTSFIAVTAYQNQEITRLKIARNPFAKGFREAGKCRSSLEAMMASFGVNVDPSSQILNRKRPINTEMKEHDSPSPSKHHPGLWMQPLCPISPSMTSAERLNIASNQLFSSVQSAPYSDFFNLPSHLINKMTERSQDNHSNDFYIKAYEQNVSLNTKADNNEMKQHDIHPAFRLQQINTQVPLLNSNYQAAAYYRGCLYNPLTSMMFLQPHAPYLDTPQSYTACSEATQSNLDTPINLKLCSQDCSKLPTAKDTNSLANNFKTCV